MLSDFVNDSAHEAALRVFEDAPVIQLSASDSRAFAKALSPAQPNARLKAAAQGYPKLPHA